MPTEDTGQAREQRRLSAKPAKTATGKTFRFSDTRDRADEIRVCGVNACRAVAETRRDSVIRAYVTETRLKAFGALLRWCAESRRAYHVVTEAELERVSQSRHHEGICLLVRQPAAPELPAFLASQTQATGPCCILLLEGIPNPHNLGAIVQVAAHFGVAGIILASDSGQTPSLSAAVHRRAEGGLEHVPVIPAPDALQAVNACRERGFTVLAITNQAAASLYAGELPPKVVFVLRSETDGLSKLLTRAADRAVAIPGSGAVENLNVACAAAVFLGEFRRLHPAGMRTPQPVACG